MSDLDQTSARFFSNMAKQPVPTSVGPAPRSAWQGVLEYFGGNPQAQALVTNQVVANPGPNQVVDPYANFANKVTGKPYR